MEKEDLQEMVMERDGKFEVLSTVDLQAEQEASEHPEPQSQPTTTSPAPPAGGAASDPQTATQLESSNSLLQEQAQVLKTPKTEKPTCLDSTSSLEVQPDVGKEGDVMRDSENTQSERDESVARSKASGTTEEREDIVTPVVRAVPARGQGEMKPKQQIRTQSAPGSRTATSAQKKREMEEEEKERKKKMSEAAFSAWVARKNDERREKERTKLKSATTGENEKEKNEMCERVYRNWLEGKNKHLKSQRMLSRPSTSVPKKDEEHCRRAFEGWLERKRTQHLEETKREKMKTQEMEESAQKADPTVIDQVYTDWLQKKKEQAREEAAKKEHYRKLYFSQPQKLKAHTLESVCFPPKKIEHPIVKKAREKKAQRFEGF